MPVGGIQNTPNTSRAKADNIKRVAIIGDSFVEALQVPYDKSVAEQLEKKLGHEFEVYRFGIGGAPMSQYLHMMRQEVLSYKPDVVIVILVENDLTNRISTGPAFMGAIS